MARTLKDLTAREVAIEMQQRKAKRVAAVHGDPFLGRLVGGAARDYGPDAETLRAAEEALAAIRSLLDGRE